MDSVRVLRSTSMLLSLCVVWTILWERWQRKLPTLSGQPSTSRPHSLLTCEYRTLRTLRLCTLVSVASTWQLPTLELRNGRQSTACGDGSIEQRIAYQDRRWCSIGCYHCIYVDADTDEHCGVRPIVTELDFRCSRIDHSQARWLLHRVDAYIVPWSCRSHSHGSIDVGTAIWWFNRWHTVRRRPHIGWRSEEHTSELQ